jgi:mono/diheme cytochrome c family protein
MAVINAGLPAKAGAHPWRKCCFKKALSRPAQDAQSGDAMTHFKRFRCLAAGFGATLSLLAAAQAATPAELLAGYSTQAGMAASAQRGQQFFNSPHGKEWSCASCHGAVPIQDGKHAATGKTIRALAPAFNPERFSDSAKAEKWFRRNCNDVLGRECSAAEKADLLSWLIGLKS